MSKFKIAKTYSGLTPQPMYFRLSEPLPVILPVITDFWNLSFFKFDSCCWDCAMEPGWIVLILSRITSGFSGCSKIFKRSGRSGFYGLRPSDRGHQLDRFGGWASLPRWRYAAMTMAAWLHPVSSWKAKMTVMKILKIAMNMSCDLYLSQPFWVILGTAPVLALYI